MTKLACKLCGDIIQSTHRHDFVMCSCQSCFIDGGDDYVRIGGDRNNFEIIEEREDDMIVLYTIDCPKCKILKQKLDSKNIQYEIVKDINAMQEMGITSVPVLSVNGELLMFADAVKYVNGR